MSKQNSSNEVFLFPVKGYLRKGACYLAMKETSKASEAYQKAIDIDANCQEALDGYRR